MSLGDILFAGLIINFMSLMIFGQFFFSNFRHFIYNNIHKSNMEIVESTLEQSVIIRTLAKSHLNYGLHQYINSSFEEDYALPRDNFLKLSLFVYYAIQCGIIASFGLASIVLIGDGIKNQDISEILSGVFCAMCLTTWGLYFYFISRRYKQIILSRVVATQEDI